MAPSQRDVRNRISAVKNIQKITRAMEMVAAARLRRAEQRIEALRPYPDAIRRMTRQAAEAAGGGPRRAVLTQHQHGRSGGPRAVGAAGRAHSGDGRTPVYFASGRRPASSLTFRGLEPAQSFMGFTDRPAYADARRSAGRLMAAYIDDEVDQVEVFYNGYISPLSQVVRLETLLPLQQATVLDGDSDQEDESSPQREHHALVEYEPDPEEILKRLLPDYVEISIYRALLESTASEHGARMTAMRNASENASTLTEDYTLEMNRARQAEITQEIMEVVAGAEGLG